MPIKDIMTPRPVTVERDDTLQVVKDIFDNLAIHHVLVVANQRLVGVVSDRDIFRAISPFVNTKAETARDTFTLNKKVHQIMTRKPVTIQAEQSVQQAARLILDNNVSCLPVMENDHLIGIVSWKDILRFGLRK